MEPTSRLDEIQIWFVATDKNIHAYAGPTFYSGGEDLARGVAEAVPDGFIFFFVRVTTDLGDLFEDRDRRPGKCGDPYTHEPHNWTDEATHGLWKCPGGTDDFNHVRKYDGLMVWEQRGTGNRWSVDLGEWVDPETNKFTSWIDEDDRPELALWLEGHPNELPDDGHWVNINEP